MPVPLRLADYDYALPEERIAQAPLAERDAARLLVLDRGTGERTHAHVRDLPDLLQPEDLLVANVTRVRPARLRGRKQSGGAVEALLLGPGTGPGEHRALLRCSGRVRPGLALTFSGEGRESIGAIVANVGERGEVLLRFAPGALPYEIGEMPLPPYIRRAAPERADHERYQTVIAREEGSVAAPTAGLHLTHTLLARLATQGTGFAEVVLHVGPGTFRPVQEPDLEAGRLHAERFCLPAATAQAVAATRARSGRVAAVGTTTTRVLEHAARQGSPVAGRGETELLIAPGFRFRCVDVLLTNFHLPRSSLLLLVCAFAGREAVLDAYAEAIGHGYRFYSYGDAMLVIG